MGDLHGLPVRLDPNPDVQGDESTVYMPPDWVPKEDDEGPGILLLDDLNRADDRILRGLMQLIQEFEMFSWISRANGKLFVPQTLRAVIIPLHRWTPLC